MSDCAAARGASVAYRRLWSLAVAEGETARQRRLLPDGRRSTNLPALRGGGALLHHIRAVTNSTRVHCTPKLSLLETATDVR